jgi:formate hydrogenlyase subunit 3/multisubunit Na+/H+ antiporter MnhD subunit
MLNHLPIVGFVLMVPVLVLAIVLRRADYKRAALLGVAAVGILTLPAFWTGEPAEEGIEHLPGVSESLIEAHEEAAELALILALVTAGIAAASWIATRKSDELLKFAMPVVTIAALGTTGVMAWVGHEGGKIRHPEINGALTAEASALPDANGQSARDEDDERDDD